MRKSRDALRDLGGKAGLPQRGFGTDSTFAPSDQVVRTVVVPGDPVVLHNQGYRRAQICALQLTQLPSSSLVTVHIRPMCVMACTLRLSLTLCPAMAYR